jgi:Na+-translocating ferredoxin:NAD+ oxidoreductase RnfC subunit
MHIGAPAVARVTQGSRVSAGEVLGAPASDALGVPVHSPIDATVVSVGSEIVLHPAS